MACGHDHDRGNLLENAGVADLPLCTFDVALSFPGHTRQVDCDLGDERHQGNHWLCPTRRVVSDRSHTLRALDHTLPLERGASEA